MSEIDIIREIARQSLCVSTATGAADNWLWDRTQRLLRNVERICELPELAEANLPIDRFALVAAAYFCESGLGRYNEAEEMPSKPVLADIRFSDLLDFSTQIVTEKLTGKLAAAKINKINRIIVESGGNSTDMTEAMILSDARNLDDMGAMGMFNEFRRYAIQGKGASGALQSWQRKIDYRYWQARLKESFRFESVRVLAQRRHLAAEYFMNQLAIENSADDLEEIVMEVSG